MHPHQELTCIHIKGDPFLKRDRTSKSLKIIASEFARGPTNQVPMELVFKNGYEQGSLRVSGA
jgi:hypothetical protein